MLKNSRVKTVLFFITLPVLPKQFWALSRAHMGTKIDEKNFSEISMFFSMVNYAISMEEKLKIPKNNFPGTITTPK